MGKDIKSKKILVIVESPSKSKHISQFLKDAGYKHATVIASVGHISNLKDKKTTYKNTGIYTNDGFKLDIGVMEDKKEIVDKIKAQVKTADYVYLMTDGDREGEAIAWSLVKFLSLKPGTYFRAVTHEITPKAVLHAIENPIELDENIIDAAHARMALDKLVGYSLSPVAKKYIGARSVGRCQSAGLKLVVDREKEIMSFIPEMYFDLYLNFEKNGLKFSAKYVGTDETPVTKIKSITEIKTIKQLCDADFIVKNINKKIKSESPKPPFCTATFQQEASSKLGLKVKDAMSIAQHLFENSYINYHRTDDTTFSQEFIDVLKPYVIENYKYYEEPRKAKAGDNAQLGHECLRVIDPSVTPDKFAEKDSNELHRKVYNLIWQRTIASVLPNAKISETIYNIYNNNQKFVLTSNEIVDLGYRVVYKFVDDSDNGAVKETFSENEILQNCELEDIKKQTQPPSRYTEASLVKALQVKEIGRPSTFATIVETVTSHTRNYSNIVEKKIVPTELGIQLSDFLDRAFSNIINLNYTKEMELSLDKIASGDLSYIDFLTEFFNTLDNSIKNNTEIKNDLENTDKVCPNCGAPMVMRRSRYGQLFYGCSKYPQCRGIININ